MVSKLVIIGVVIVVGLWAAYFANIGGFREFVDNYMAGSRGKGPYTVYNPPTYTGH